MEKHRESQRDLHCIFIDLKKAYDWVPRSEVWNCLWLKGVEEKYIRLIQDMYTGSKTRIRCAARTTDDFEVSVGLHQGSALSPFIFDIVMDCLMGQVSRRVRWDMMFADDVVLCAETRAEVEVRLEEWSKAMEDRDLKVSRGKTEHLCVRLRRFGHVLRRDEEYIVQRLRRMQVGTRGRGRPKRWLDCITEDLLAVGAVEEGVQDRGKWKRLIHTATPARGIKPEEEKDCSQKQKEDKSNE